MAITRRTLLKSAALGALASAGPLACAGGSKTHSASAGTPEAKAAPAPAKAAAGPKKILILGGTGFLGPALVKDAKARGHKVTIFNRGKTRPGLFDEERDGVEKLLGNRDGDLKALEGRSWDAVIDTSGYVPRIVKASAELLAPSVKQYLFISTVSVYARLDLVGMDEDAPLETLPEPASEDVPKYYGALKAACERAAEAAMPGRVTNIRPGLIVGEGDPTDRFTYWPVRVERGGQVLAPGTGKDPVQVIDVRDLAAWTITCIERGTVGVFNALGPENGMPMSALLDACKKVTGSDATFTWVPASFLEQQQIRPWADMPAWIPAEGETKGIGTTSVRRAVAAGLTFRPIEDTVRSTLDWWKTLPAERQQKPVQKAWLSPEREQAVLAAWAKSAPR